jgi:membrane protein implicated in regulation of membrane protease activity
MTTFGTFHRRESPDRQAVREFLIPLALADVLADYLNRSRGSFMLPMLIAMVLPILGVALFYLFPFEEAFPMYLACILISAPIYYGMLSVMGRKRKVQTGSEKMIGEEALVVVDIDPRGKVEFEGELWSATAKGTKYFKGEKVKIRSVEGLVLSVEKDIT